MPTKRRRHAITETDAVKAVLDPLRAELGTDSIDLPELIVLGAQEKLSRLRSDREDRDQRLRRLAERVRSGNIPVDVTAADEVRRTGWTSR
jgi:hypothetical protein